MTEPINPQANQSTEVGNEINLFDLLVILVKRWKVIVGLSFAVAVLAAGYSLTMPNIYTAKTKILPPQQSQSAASAMLAQLGGGIAGLVGGVGLKNPNDLYVTMFKSRAVADNLIQRFELMKLWDIDASHPSDAYVALAGVTKITSEKDGSISIEVDDKDAKRAAEIANAYVDELVKFTSMLALTDASQRRLFYERQFALARDNLAKAEASARLALLNGGLVKVDDQGRAMVETIARLRGQITVKEVQIGTMRAFAADRNPDLQLALQELVSLRRELVKLEGPAGTKDTTKGQGGEGNDSLRLLRDVKYYEVIFDLLARQYEMAKIDEAKDSTLIQVIDKAVEPDRKSKPFRSRFVLLATFIALFIVILWAFVHEGVVWMMTAPRYASHRHDLKRYLAWK